MSIPFPSPSPRRPAHEADPARTLRDALRDELVNGMHLGRLRPGQRLPSIRALAREHGLDHRAVARVYQELEQAGLVEIRGRSGVCVAPPAGVPRPAPPGDGWSAAMIGMLTEAWSAGTSPGDLRERVSHCLTTSELRCVCVESNEDQMTAYCTEIQQLTGISTTPAYLAHDDVEEVREESREAMLRAAVARADLVVTTRYHAAAVRAVLGDSPVPLVVLRVHDDLKRRVRDRLRRGTLVVVSATREFGDRLRLMYHDLLDDASRLRVVLADDPAAAGLAAGTEPILLTMAARERIGERNGCPLVAPHFPTLSRDTLQELAETVVRIRNG